MENNQQYHRIIKIFHWGMAVLVLGMLCVGLYMTGLDREDPLRGQLYGLHKSFGALILFLVMARLAVRWRTRVPPLPETIPPVQRRLGMWGHRLLYVLMFAVPLAGIAMSNSWGYGVSMFGLELPRLFPENKDIAPLMGDLHEILALSLLGLIGLHVAGVVKHAVVDKENLLRRMWGSKARK